MVVKVLKYLIETCQQMLKGTDHVISSNPLFKEFIMCPLNLELSKEWCRYPWFYIWQIDIFQLRVHFLEVLVCSKERVIQKELRGIVVNLINVESLLIVPTVPFSLKSINK